MKELRCKNITLSDDKTLVCVPVTGANLTEIKSQAKQIRKMKPDLVEWRADFLKIEDPENDVVELTYALKVLHKSLKSLPILFTFRNTDEGGTRRVNFETYKKYLHYIALMADKCNVDLIDVEAYSKRDVKGIDELIDEIHDADVKIIGSCHKVNSTPRKQELVEILTNIEEMGCDVCKLAVLPHNKYDVEELIGASCEANEKLKAPIVTMAMEELGAITRVCTKLTKSCITFAAGVEESAPGQLSYEITKNLLEVNHNSRVTENISLIGFMGTGKTTVSHALSRILGMDEVDTDKTIVEQTGKQIAELYPELGEEKFRNLETEILRDISKRENTIISCGGGIVLRNENVHILKDTSTVVRLDADPEVIFKRVKRRTTRPLLNDDMSLEHVKSMMNEREGRYSTAADITVNVDGGERVMTCYRIIEQLKKSGVLRVD